METLIQRLVANPHDEEALAYAHRGLGGWQGLADLLSTVPLALGYAALLVLLLQRPANSLTT